MTNFILKKINQIVDHRGSIQALECSDFFNSKFERFYFLKFTSENVIRGYHAHKNLIQIFFLINGSVEVSLDDGEKKSIVILDDYKTAIFLTKPLWRTVKPLEKNSIMGVLCDKVYDTDDYIRDYNEFIKYVKKV